MTKCINKVIGAINKRTKAGKGFTILAVAEGAISKEDAALSKKEYKEKVAKRKYPSVSYEIADRIFEETGVEVRAGLRFPVRGRRSFSYSLPSRRNLLR